MFLNIKIARDSVDVNVTPDKRQIFLDNEKLLVTTVKVCSVIVSNVPLRLFKLILVDTYAFFTFDSRLPF